MLRFLKREPFAFILIPVRLCRYAARFIRRMRKKDMVDSVSVIGVLLTQLPVLADLFCERDEAINLHGVARLFEHLATDGFFHGFIGVWPPPGRS